MKNNTVRNLAFLFAVVIALSSCASTKVANDPHAPFLGNWDYAVQDLPVDIDGTFVITKEEGVLKAHMVNPMGEMTIEDITIEDISSNMYDPNVPDPDLLIRTGGDLRISNFLLWEMAYTEIYVTDVMWPDFRETHLFEAIKEYQNRDRRFGGVKDNE